MAMAGGFILARIIVFFFDRVEQKRSQKPYMARLGEVVGAGDEQNGKLKHFGLVDSRAEMVNYGCYRE